MAIYHIHSTTTTNDLLRDEKYREGDVVWADFQTAGRGQRGHKWSSDAGENLLFSVALEPAFLPVTEQFLLSETVALSLSDLLADYGIATKIKWTNDIYVGDRKIVGILIEHIYSGAKLTRTIVGIGLNVNQCEFDPSLPNPTSMALQTGKRYDLREVLEHFVARLMYNYEQLRQGAGQRIQSRYIASMYRRGEQHTFALPDGTRFRGTILGVRPSGELIIDHADGTRKEYLFKQVEFVL